MPKAGDLEKRIQDLKKKLQPPAEGTEPAPTAPERVRHMRKRLKRTQRKLRKMKAAEARTAARKKGKAETSSS
ncbi:MAG: hypothetical protein AB1640_00750 [bacterium]